MSVLKDRISLTDVILNLKVLKYKMKDDGEINGIITRIKEREIKYYFNASILHFV